MASASARRMNAGVSSRGSPMPKSIHVGALGLEVRRASVS